MTTTYEEAKDEIYSQFFAAWVAGSAAIVGYVPEVRWQNLEEATKPDQSKYWARVSTQSVDEPQANLGADAEGKRRYTGLGLVFVQIFVPKTEGNDYKGAKLAELARNAYRGKKTTGGVWFRNVRINNLEPEELFYRFNVVAEYEYDEIG